MTVSRTGGSGLLSSRGDRDGVVTAGLINLHYILYISQSLFTFKAQLVFRGTTTVAISISWKSAGTENVSYVVMWETDDIGGCSGGSDMNSITITDGSTSYVIIGLEENTTYNIIVTAYNSVGSSAASNMVNAITQKAGKNYDVIIISYYERITTHSSICLSNVCECV